MIYHKDTEFFDREAVDEVRRIVEMAEKGQFYKDSASEAMA